MLDDALQIVLVARMKLVLASHLSDEQRRDANKRKNADHAVYGRLALIDGYRFSFRM
jgi:hypothetical protein